MSSSAVIDRLEAERGEQEDFIEQLLNKVDEEQRDLVDAEQSNLKAARERIAQLDKQLEPLREFAKLRTAHRESGGDRYRSTANGQAEGKGLGAQTQTRGHEYRDIGELMADAWRAKTHQDEAASKRLESIGRGISNGKLQVIDAAKARDVDAAYLSSLSGEQRADAPHNTTVEIPGLMPVSIQGPVVNNIDASRPFINSIGGAKDMSGIPGKVFSRPIVTEHLQVGTQSAEKAEVVDGQFKVDDVDFTKSTEGGWANVSRQSIDWSSPAVWNALLTDFQDIYARHTENKAADAWFTAVQTGTAIDTAAATGTTPTLNELITSLYAGAVAVYGLVQKMPDHIWMSLDRWALVSALIDQARAGAAGSNLSPSSLGNFQQGGLLDMPRTVVPSLATGTLVIGVARMTEAYEERLGFLSAVEPELLGVKLAYGGYFASGTLDVNAFAELTFS